MIKWKEVPGHPMYEVSAAGEIRSWKRFKGNGRARPMSVVRADSPRLLSVARRGKAKYQSVELDGKRRLVHQIVLEAFVGPRPPGMQCRHLNDDPDDNRLENLQWGTPSENGLDRTRNGRAALGLDHHNGRLTAEQAVRVRQDTRTYAEISAEFGISHGSIAAIKAGETYAWASPEVKPRRRSRSLARAKITEDEARAIIADPRTQDKIAADYGVCRVTISDIKRGRSWKHLPRPGA